MRKVYSSKRHLALGLGGALVIALAVVAGALMWASQASAERAVVLIHVTKDGTDYKGNPECLPGNGQPVDALGNPSLTIASAERGIDDCNNLIGTTHLIRTEGFATTMVADANPWTLVSGPGVILRGNPALLCGAMTEATSLPGWDATNNAEHCVLITSNEQGETSIRFGYTYTPTPTPPPTPTVTPLPGATPGPPPAGHNFTDLIVKEWNKLDHTEIWQLNPACTDSPTTCTLSDLVGEGDLTGETLVVTSEVPIVFDTNSDRLRGLKRLREIVWGWHDDPVDPVMPIEGARVTAIIDNNEDGVADTFHAGTCAFFTTFNTVGTPPDRGTQLTGITRTHLDGTTVVTHALFDDPLNPGADLLLHDIYVDTDCKEVTTIRIKVEYPVGIFSEPGVIWEKTKINWQEREAGKQPQIR